MVNYALKVLNNDRLYFYTDNAKLYKRVIEMYQDFIKRIEGLTYVATVRNQAEFLYYLIDNYLNNINILEDSYKSKSHTDK